MATHPVGDFTWVGRIPDGCTGTVTWDVDFVPESGYSNTPPYYEATSDGRVVVTAGVEADGVTPMPVSPGILTFTPTVTNGGDSVTMNPIVLEIRMEAIRGGMIALAGISSDYSGMVWLADGPPFSLSGTIPYVDHSQHVSYSPDGSFLAVGMASGKLKIYRIDHNLNTLTDIRTFAIGDFTDLEFSPDGTRLSVMLSVSPYWVMYNTESWSTISVPTTSATYGNSSAFSPDGSKIVVVFRAGTSALVRIHDATTLATIKTVSMPKQKSTVSWSPNGNQIAFGGTISPYLHLYDVSSDSLTTVTLSFKQFREISYSPDGKWLAGAISSSDTLLVFNTENWGIVKSSLGYGDGYGIAWSPDSSYIAVSFQNYPFCKVFSAGTWGEVFSFSSASGINQGRRVAIAYY